MRRIDARTVRSSRRLSIANDGSEPQVCGVKVSIVILFVNKTLKYSCFLMGMS